ncbi:hypothetical protein [Paenibacillus macquariensis]|uniref:RNA polymerase alpha subunit C-terminal domain-containing protein n=1 Tax=Paenibacillus macquariensis TaxID=948756 RepID=A0ABY1K1H1_9BACL|nr:hypothetical protein [Paenibacillus macquariensis]MEC0091787.1 hypothetical protein [Paenibacillus macquariensis]OAB32298.1 hypothetical protein PMSM_16955 [Paenibacillus macquariensis subsp. macquariensis]SIR11982.1 hypothetical protein SAMN05421578_107128 [Paenibacillus macquariensis]
MVYYNYEFFSETLTEQNFKEILKIEGDYSDIPFYEIFVENHTTTTKSAINAIGRTAYSSNGVVTLEDLLQLKFEKLARIRNMGKGSQLTVLDSLLKYFNLGGLFDEEKQREINANMFMNIASEKEIDSLRELLSLVYNELSVVQQEDILRKIT